MTSYYYLTYESSRQGFCRNLCSGLVVEKQFLGYNYREEPCICPAKFSLKVRSVEGSAHLYYLQKVLRSAIRFSHIAALDREKYFNVV